MKHESKNKRENVVPENPSSMQENKQISETKKNYKPLVKKREWIETNLQLYKNTMKLAEEERNTKAETERKREAPRRKKVWKRKWSASKLG